MKKKIALGALSILLLSQISYGSNDPRIQRLLKIAKKKQAEEAKANRLEGAAEELGLEGEEVPVSTTGGTTGQPQEAARREKAQNAAQKKAEAKKKKAQEKSMTESEKMDAEVQRIKKRVMEINANIEKFQRTNELLEKMEERLDGLAGRLD